MRYFYNSTASVKAQTDLLKKGLAKFFTVTAARGGQGQAPPTFTEVLSLLKEVAAEAGCNEASLRLGSAYSGVKKSPESSLQNQIDEIRRVQQQQQQAGNRASGEAGRSRKRPAASNQGPAAQKSRGGGGGRGGKGGKNNSSALASLNGKLSRTCMTWNSGEFI